MMGPRNMEKREPDQVEQGGEHAGDGGESAACAAEQAPPEVTDQLYGSGPYIHIYICTGPMGPIMESSGPPCPSNLGARTWRCVILRRFLYHLGPNG